MLQFEKQSFGNYYIFSFNSGTLSVHFRSGSVPEFIKFLETPKQKSFSHTKFAFF